MNERFTPQGLPIIQKSFAEDYYNSLKGCDDIKRHPNIDIVEGLGRTFLYLGNINKWLNAAQCSGIEKVEAEFGKEKAHKFLDSQIAATRLLILQGKEFDPAYKLPIVFKGIFQGVTQHVIHLSMDQQLNEAQSFIDENPNYFSANDEFAKNYIKVEKLASMTGGKILGWYNMLREASRKNKFGGLEG